MTSRLRFSKSLRQERFFWEIVSWIFTVRNLTPKDLKFEIWSGLDFFLQIFWWFTGNFEKKHFFLYFWKRGYYFTFLVTYYFSASENSVRVAIGFTAGQIQIIDMATRYFLDDVIFRIIFKNENFSPRDDTRRSLQKINDATSNDNSTITSLQESVFSFFTNFNLFHYFQKHEAVRKIEISLF